jgi:hypothetical protein
MEERDNLTMSMFLQGYGTNFYMDEEYYEGEWYGDKRSGWGRMYYKDGTIYEGEWFDDKRNGQGMLRLRKHFHHTTCIIKFLATFQQSICFRNLDIFVNYCLNVESTSE